MIHREKSKDYKSEDKFLAAEMFISSRVDHLMMITFILIRIIMRIINSVSIEQFIDNKIKQDHIKHEPS